MPQATRAQVQTDAAHMQLALELAADAALDGEVPVGAIVVKDGVVVGTGKNQPIHSCDPTAHAEVIALRAAAKALGNYRLDGCTLYVTLEPCAMCCGAMLHGRISRVVYGAADPKTGCAGSVLNIFAQAQLNHQTQVEGGVLAPEAAQQLQHFFQGRRAHQRGQTMPLREDALRTPQSCFAALTDFPWAEHFVCDLPSLEGLRLHFLDEAGADSESTYLVLHPVPGWSYSYRVAIPSWLEEGARVVIPDLVGFGKSDKPKREAVHALDWHVRYLQELLDRLQIDKAVLVAPDSAHPLVLPLMASRPGRISRMQIQTIPSATSPAQEQHALQAPYPDAGHRAALRAFARMAASSAKIQT